MARNRKFDAWLEEPMGVSCSVFNILNRNGNWLTVDHLSKPQVRRMFCRSAEPLTWDSNTIAPLFKVIGHA